MTSTPHTKFEITKTFTKGGQVSLHNLRMLRQVLSVTVLLTIVVFMGILIIKTWSDYTPYQREVLQSAYWTKINLILSGNKTYLHPTLQLWTQHFERQFIKNVWTATSISGSIFLLICGFWIWRGHAKTEKEILTGTEAVADKQLTTLIHKQNMASDFTLAGVPLIKDKEKQHILVIGTTGSGKTNCIHELLQQVRAKGQKAIIVDMTGAFIERYYRPESDSILNPLDARSKQWCIWHDSPKTYHLRLLTSVLFPPDARGHESYWTKASRTVFIATAEKLHLMSKLSTSEFFKFATNLPIRQAETFYRDTSAAAIMNGDAAETVMGVRSNIRANTECLEFFKEPEDPFSIRTWITEENTDAWLFLSSPPELREELAPLLSLWTTIATDALMALPPSQNRRLWLVIDELPAIKKLPKLQTMLAEVRKYGGCVILGTQDMCQLDEIYGPNTVKSIANLCSTKVIFRIEGAEIAERLSKWLGMQEVSETLENISYGAHQMRDGVSLNDHRKEKPTIHPDRLMKLPDLTAYLKLPGDYPIAKLTFQIHKGEKAAEGYIEAL